MIEASELTKRYGAKTAVDGLSFTVRPGVVTGFLGPNGAGKSTTMRMIVGLDAPSSGEVTVDGALYRDLPAPLHRVGAPRRPGHARPRRAGQRPRPRGHPLDPHAAAQAGRRRPHDPGLLAPD